MLVVYTAYVTYPAHFTYAAPFRHTNGASDLGWVYGAGLAHIYPLHVRGIEAYVLLRVLSLVGYN